MKNTIENANEIYERVVSNVDGKGISVVELNSEEIRICCEAYKITNDEKYLHCIVLTHMRYVKYYMSKSKFNYTSEFYEEAVNEGYVVLVNIVNKYDANKNSLFIPFLRKHLKTAEKKVGALQHTDGSISTLNDRYKINKYKEKYDYDNDFDLTDDALIEIEISRNRYNRAIQNKCEYDDNLHWCNEKNMYQNVCVDYLFIEQLLNSIDDLKLRKFIILKEGYRFRKKELLEDMNLSEEEYKLMIKKERIAFRQIKKSVEGINNE